MEKIYIKKAYDEFARHAVGTLSVTVEVTSYSFDSKPFWKLYGACESNPGDSFWTLHERATFEEALEDWKELARKKRGEFSKFQE